MAKQSVLLTAMPNGLTENQELRVSVLISPRLDAQSQPPELATFPDFVDWPEVLFQSEFTLRFGNQSVVIPGNELQTANRIDASYGLADSSIWSAMLPPQSRVDSFTFQDMTNRSILSYSTSRMADRQKNLLATLARQASDQLPEIQTILADPEWAKFASDIVGLDRRFTSENDNGSYLDVQRMFSQFLGTGKFSEIKDQQERDLAHFQLFHMPPGEVETQTYAGTPAQDRKTQAKWRTHKPAALPSSAELASKYDFHQIVAAMNQYPTLLRRMGLVIDFIIEPSLFNPNTNGTLTAFLTMPSSAGNISHEAQVPPRVHCHLDASSFYLRSSGQPQKHKVPISQGLLQITLEHFNLIQHDVDGTGIKVMNTARTLAHQKPDRLRLDPTSRIERTSGVPAPRNAGIMLVQRDRATDLAQRFKNSSKMNSKYIAAQQNTGGRNAQGPDLFAEDLVRGYRIDIWDAFIKSWKSLCQRSGSYEIEGQALLHVAEEEGLVRLAATQSADRNSNPDLLYLHEMLMAWTGWSLVAPAPGKIVNREDDPDVQDTEVPPGIPLKTKYQALPNSLPRLRYGRSYWVRARAVDLAANSLPPKPDDYANESPQTQAQVYLRYDPIKAPALALRKADANSIEKPFEGESMLCMAIRSFNETPDLNTVDSTQVSHRFVLSEASSVKDAELHGMLDNNGQMDPGFFTILAQQDAPLASEVLLSPAPAIINPDTPAPGKTEYAVFTEKDQLPYLPDPLCVEIAARIFNHPDIAETTIIPIKLYANNRSWPHALPFKIKLFERTGSTVEYLEQEQILSIPLAKGCRAKLRLSVKPDKRSLELLGIWHWLSDPEKNDLRSKALAGQHWMLTPWREVDLVHAVQKPLIAPTIDPKGLFREAGATWSLLHYHSAVSLKSTEQIELWGQWNDPVVLDEKAIANRVQPANQARIDRAYSIKITAPHNYRGVPEHDILKPDLIRAGNKLPGPSRKIHEFGDTRYRRVEYWLQATSRFREYMPAALLTQTVNNKLELTDDHLKVIGDKLVTWIPNASNPPAPEVLYVVPTFQWIRPQENAGKQHSLRRGGGLRVYLDRPWNTSGYGEMLAVVLPGSAMSGADPNTTPGSQPVKNFVTQWGNDAVWKSAFVPSTSPKAADFPRARTAPDPSGSWLPDFAEASEADQQPGNFLIKDLPHPQIKSSSIKLKKQSNDADQKLVNIAPHDVFYDEVRQLWYCDIELSPKNAYYPFVRLALARYQPTSVPGKHLSNIILADFMTLANDRCVTVTKNSDAQMRTVEVFGNSYSSSSAVEEAKSSGHVTTTINGETKIVAPVAIANRTVVEVWVEKLDSSLGDDFGWSRDDQVSIKRLRGTIKPKVTNTTTTTKLRAKKRRQQARALIKERDFTTILNNGLITELITQPSLWRGTVTLPENTGRSQTKWRRRLVIAEYEEYYVDDEVPYDNILRKKDRRMVYVEHMEL